ncbi:MAG: ABC transporter permease [Clostridia bacterium]|nr:ABC transporter permease [Clostridia bacterium]
MEAFKASFVNEIEKMYKKKKAVVIVIISLVVIVLGQLAVIGVRNGLGLRAAGSTQFPILVLSLFVNTILPLFTALVTIDIFTGEFSQNSMKVIITRPVTRFKVFSSKIAAITFFVLANLFVVMLLSTVAGLLFNTNSLTPGGILRIILSYTVTALPVMTLALTITVFANIFKSGSAVFFLSILMFIVFKALGYVFSQYSSLFATSMLGWYNLWIANDIPVFKVFRLFLIMLGYAIMSFTAGFYLFDKRDL